MPANRGDLTEAGNAPADGAIAVFDAASKGLRLGGPLRVTTGAAGVAGTSAAMSGGTVTVNTTAVTANSIIMLQYATPGGTQGFLRVSAISAGTSFTITSSSGTDTSTVSWLIVN